MKNMLKNIAVALLLNYASADVITVQADQSQSTLQYLKEKVFGRDYKEGLIELDLNLAQEKREYLSEAA